MTIGIFSGNAGRASGGLIPRLSEKKIKSDSRTILLPFHKFLHRGPRLAQSESVQINETTERLNEHNHIIRRNNVH